MSDRKRTVHLDLSEQGFEGEWLDLRDPWFMSQQQFNALLETSKTEPQTFLRQMVAAGSLADVNGTTVTDFTALDFETIPAGIVKTLTDRLQELFAATVPKASRTGQSST